MDDLTRELIMEDEAADERMSRLDPWEGDDEEECAYPLTRSDYERMYGLHYQTV